MSERAFHYWLCVAWIGAAVVTFVALFKVSAPYGRHSRAGWGPALPFVAAWMLMEAPSALGMAFWFSVGDRPADPAAIALLALWELHYLHRAFLDPWLRRRTGRPIPLSVVLMAMGFNLVNTYLNGRWLFSLAPATQGGVSTQSPAAQGLTEWSLAAFAASPVFWVGLALFLGGLGTNLWADGVLRRLRAPGERGYKIPRGGLYEWISCPNYLAEILEWTGFALLTGGSLGALSFVLWTVANLAPRAAAHHRWYQEKFPDYPARRKALVPGLW